MCILYWVNQSTLSAAVLCLIEPEKSLSSFSLWVLAGSLVAHCISAASGVTISILFQCNIKCLLKISQGQTFHAFVMSIIKLHQGLGEQSNHIMP